MRTDARLTFVIPDYDFLDKSIHYHSQIMVGDLLSDPSLGFITTRIDYCRGECLVTRYFSRADQHAGTGRALEQSVTG